jgi:hypothetical protein
MRHKFVFQVLLGIALTITSRTALAFCGFYVAGGDTSLFNNATMVVLMREGQRTVLSMQNNYQGPPANFAMVVPVPVVLQQDNVKTLPRDVFKHIDQLAAPRLVEYWEQDPCLPPAPQTIPMPAAAPAGAVHARKAGGGDLGVTIEAQFTVGEYQIVILSAKDSTGLDTWLKQEKYKIPAGAEPVLRPYVQSGMKFFVAKVDASKVTFVDGQAMLSPLRFHYDTDKFTLPVRLGLLNSAGTQDLIVHILAKGQRYEAANYPNVTIPTNLDVSESTRDEFAPFYAALFDDTVARNPRSVVTEYSWDASSCDPCPTPALSMGEIATLGADVLPSSAPVPPPPTPGGAQPNPTHKDRRGDAPRTPPSPLNRGRIYAGGFVLTRLHVRYGKDSLGDDLVFREAPAIEGGREWSTTNGGKLATGAEASPVNNFQGRYAIRHPWAGPIACENPRRGIWGGPPAGVTGSTEPRPALNLAFARRDLALASFLQPAAPGATPPSAAPSASASASATPPVSDAAGPAPSKSRCAAGTVGEEAPAGGALALGLSFLGVAIARRRRG